MLAPPGPVLELGSGLTTYLLRASCVVTGRKFVTVDDDEDRLIPYRHQEGADRSIIYSPEWEVTPTLANVHWALVFIGRSPIQQRLGDIVRFASASIVVVAGSNLPSISQYEIAFANFKHRMDYRRLDPSTTLLSNEIDVRKHPASEWL